MTKISNPVVRESIPWYLRFILFFIPATRSRYITNERYYTTCDVSYKKLFGVIYIVREDWH